MFKVFVALLVAVSAVSARPQSLSYEIPAGQVTVTRGLGVQPPSAPVQILQVIPAQQQVSPQIVFAIPAPAPEPVTQKPQYSYSYEVNSPETGDVKSASESRDGDKVTGAYQLQEPDGAIRKVTYTADAENGFQANVERTEAPKAVAVPIPVQPAPPRPVQILLVAQPQPQQSTIQLVAQPQQSAFQLVPAGASTSSLLGGNVILIGQK